MLNRSQACFVGHRREGRGQGNEEWCRDWGCAGVLRKIVLGRGHGWVDSMRGLLGREAQSSELLLQLADVVRETGECVCQREDGEGSRGRRVLNTPTLGCSLMVGMDRGVFSEHKGC